MNEKVGTKFLEKHKFHYIFIVDVSGSSTEEVFKKSLDELKNDFGNKLSIPDASDKFLKNIVTYKMVKSLYQNSTQLFRDNALVSYFQLEESDIVEKRKNIPLSDVEKNGLYQEILNAKNHNNVTTDFEGFLKNLSSKLNNYSAAVIGSNDEMRHFFSVTVVSDFINEEDNYGKKFSKVLDFQFQRDSKIQLNLYKVPGEFENSYEKANDKSNAFVKDMRQMKNNNVCVYDDFEFWYEKLNDNIDDYSIDDFFFHLESVSTPIISMTNDTVYKINNRNEMNFYEGEAFVSGEKNTSINYNFSIVEGCDNQDKNATLRYSKFYKDSSNSITYYDREGLVSVDNPKNTIINLSTWDAVKFSSFSPRNPNYYEADLYLKIHQQTKNYQFLLPLGFENY